MRIQTIWTIPAMSLMERCRRTVDTFCMEIAWAMPKRIRMWATIHSINVTAGKTGGVVPEITVEEILRHMPKPEGM